MIGVVDAFEVDRGDAEIAMSELALDNWFSPGQGGASSTG
jgi:hypothetical protein